MADNIQNVKELIAEGIKIPTYLKILIAKENPDWVLQNYPEWIIELGKMPKPYRRK